MSNETPKFISIHTSAGTLSGLMLLPGVQPKELDDLCVAMQEAVREIVSNWLHPGVADAP